MPLHLKQSARNGETISRDSRINWTHKKRLRNKERQREEQGESGAREYVERVRKS